MSFTCSLGAAYLPFAATDEEREAQGVPSPSKYERYGNLADYKGRVEAASRALVASGFLLSADAEEIVAAANVVLP